MGQENDNKRYKEFYAYAMELKVFAIFVTNKVGDLILHIFVTNKVIDFIFYMLIHILGVKGPVFALVIKIYNLFSAIIVFGWYSVHMKVYNYTRNQAMHIIITHDGYK